MQNGPKLIEMRPNPLLLNSNFEGYKLSLKPIHNVTQQLKIPVDRLHPNKNQFSLIETKLYSTHNHLIGENDETESVYFVDNELNIQRFSVDSATNQFSCEIVWKIPMEKERTCGAYNISLRFASDRIAIVGDGMGHLYVLDRSLDEKWNVMYSGDPIGPEQQFILVDALYKETPQPQIHLLLSNIKRNDETERHYTVLYWVIFEKNELWKPTAPKELTVNGCVQYATLEATCECIYVVSDAGCKFTNDPSNELHDGKKYEWMQGLDDIIVTFTFPHNIDKNLINVDSEDNRISVKYDANVLLEGNLYKRIDPNLTCWSSNNTSFDVVLQKVDGGLMWPEIVSGDTFGEYVSNPELLDEVRERLAPLTSCEKTCPPSGITFNSQPIEECDFEYDRLSVFERISLEPHKVTHKANIGSNKVLVTVKLDKELPLALGIRSDVDTCIWQPIKTSEDFKLEHTGTLLALGYIQASKQQMKFFVCSPNLNYSIICEATRHIFMYCQNKSITSNELRNRTTGRRINTVAQQQVYSLPCNDEILGIYASNSYLYVLGENFITSLKL